MKPHFTCEFTVLLSQGYGESCNQQQMSQSRAPSTSWWIILHIQSAPCYSYSKQVIFYCNWYQQIQRISSNTARNVSLLSGVRLHHRLASWIKSLQMCATFVCWQNRQTTASPSFMLSRIKALLFVLEKLQVLFFLLFFTFLCLSLSMLHLYCHLLASYFSFLAFIALYLKLILRFILFIKLRSKASTSLEAVTRCSMPLFLNLYRRFGTWSTSQV